MVENDQSGVNVEQAELLFRALRDYLQRDDEGRRVIAAFEKNPEQGHEDLARYLRQRLDGQDRDDQLAEQLADVLGGGQQIVTNVTGGHVDQIVNIAEAGVVKTEGDVSIGQADRVEAEGDVTADRIDKVEAEGNVYLRVFNSVKQVVAFVVIVLATILLVGGGVALARHRAAQPDVMGGDFNIAVAEFNEEPATRDPEVAPLASQMLFNFLDAEYQLSPFGDVEVAHDKIGIIPGATEAEQLAQDINAQLVIYGDVGVIGDRAVITPKFYVSESFRADVDEVSGQHQFRLPVEFSVTDILNAESDVNQELQDRTTLLTEFTKAVAYLASDNLEPALEAIENAIAEAESYGGVEGQEVLYLFASTITRKLGDFVSSTNYVDQALDRNQSYGRAFIAKGNIFYDEQDFETAKQYYEEATGLLDQPPGAYINEKANSGLGNIYNYLYQTADPADKPALAEQTLTHFQAVIDSYENDPDPGAILRDLAAWAYYGSGIIHQLEGDNATAVQAFESAIDNTEDVNLLERARNRLDQVK